MTTRPTKEAMFMQMAYVASQRATCRRLRVGCVITNVEGTQVVAIGYNGNARGLVNDCDSETAGACGCIHAEVNALLKAPYEGAGPLNLYTTTAPCAGCAKLILNSRVKTVIYDKQYRVFDGLAVLSAGNVLVRHISTYYEEF